MIRPDGRIPNRPNPNTYWVLPDKLMAGEYPGAKDGADAKTRIRRYLDCGITSFIDLTEPHELEPYESLLLQEASITGKTVDYLRMPIRDVSVPDSKEQAI